MRLSEHRDFQQAVLQAAEITPFAGHLGVDLKGDKYVEELPELGRAPTARTKTMKLLEWKLLSKAASAQRADAAASYS